jgi:hypothetical protein
MLSLLISCAASMNCKWEISWAHEVRGRKEGRDEGRKEEHGIDKREEGRYKARKKGRMNERKTKEVQCGWV